MLWYFIRNHSTILLTALLSKHQFFRLFHNIPRIKIPWWRHQMEISSALLDICAGTSSVPGEFPAQRPVTQSFDVFFYLRLNKRLSKHSWGWWFETLSRPLWHHCNGLAQCGHVVPDGDVLRFWVSISSGMDCCLTSASHHLNQCWLIIMKYESLTIV